MDISFLLWKIKTIDIWQQIWFQGHFYVENNTPYYQQLNFFFWNVIRLVMFWRYRLFWVSVSVLDLNWNSGFSRSLGRMSVWREFSTIYYCFNQSQNSSLFSTGLVEIVFDGRKFSCTAHWAFLLHKGT